MASVKEMRTRIGSVKSTQKITKALQMVAAAKLRRAQSAAEAARPYARGMANVIANLAAGVSGPSAPLLLAGTGSDKRHLVIVATSDRGLAGGFNWQHPARRARKDRGADRRRQGRQDHHHRPQGPRRAAPRLWQPLLETYEVGIKAPGFALVKPIAQKVLDAYTNGEYRRRHADPFLLQVGGHPDAARAAADPGPGRETGGGPAPFYDYEPDEDAILNELLPQNISVQLLTALLENQAGFFASQMTAMDNATRNAGDMIKALTIQMNRTRQAQITKELIEIISGAAAV